MATIMLDLAPVGRRRPEVASAGRLPHEVYVRRRLAVALAAAIVVVGVLLSVAGLPARSLSESPGGIPASVTGRTPAAAGASAVPAGLAGLAGVPSTYVVRAGDTLWSIGESLGVERVASFVDEVAELNGTATLDVGMLLILPD